MSAMGATFRLGDWEVLPDLHRLRRGGDVVAVEPRLMAVLEELARAPGRVVTRDDLHRTVWGGVFVTDDALNRCITQLRRILGDDARAPRFIETISKRGYRLIAPVTREASGLESSVVVERVAAEDPVEVHVLRTGALGHVAEVALRGSLDEEGWGGLALQLRGALGTTGDDLTMQREGVLLTARPDAARGRFVVRTRTLAGATPLLIAVAAFLVAGLLLYGRTLQFGHGLGLALLAGAAGLWAGGRPRRRALDRSRAVIAAFGESVRRAGSQTR